MSDGIMEALDSGTSSESESDTPELPLKALKCSKHSPSKIKFISRAVDVSSDSDTTVCLNNDKELSGKSTITLDSDENLIKNISKQKSSAKKNEDQQGKENVASSSNTKKRVKVISETDSSSNDSETTALLHDTSADSSTDVQVCEIPKSNTKKTSKMAENTKKTNLKRKRSFESSDNEDKINFESKRKQKNSSVNHPDEIVKGNCVTPLPVSGKKKTSLSVVKKNKSDSVTVKKKLVSAGSKKLSVKNESITVSLVKSESSVSSDSDPDENVSRKSVTLSPASGKKKISPSAVKKKKADSSGRRIVKELVSASTKKNSPVQNPKSSIDNKKQTPTSKFSDPKKKLDSSDILERLHDSSNGTNDLSSSEEIEMEEPQKADKKSDATSSSDSEDSHTLKENDKILQQKKTRTSSNSSSSDSSSSDSSSSDSSLRDSDSDDDLKAKKTTKKTKDNFGPAAKRSKTKARCSSTSEQELVNISPKKKKTTPKGEKIDKKGSKKNDKITPGTGRIVRLQRYLKEAGIRVKNYETLWQGCKSDKARAEKLLELLHARGLKGKPSIAECRKLKKKFETQKEISELNTSNIIAANGRSRRGASNPFGSRRSSSPQSTKKQETSPKSSPKFKKMFRRLRNIVDSENDSD